MVTEEMLLDTLKSWCFLNKRIKRLNEMLNEVSFSVTASYSSDSKVSSSGTEVSKIERFCMSRMNITDEITQIKRKMNLCKIAYKNSDLNQHEECVIKALVHNKSLLELSKELGVSQAKIYRIRDKAIKKMSNTLQNEVIKR